jgi:hypothetical protein
MSRQDIEGDFMACDAAVLNRFFADYLASHGQGGTNTRQRNPSAPVHLAGGAFRARRGLRRFRRTLASSHA